MADTCLILYFLDYKKDNIFNYFSVGSNNIKILINGPCVSTTVNNPDNKYYEHYEEIFKLFKDEKVSTFDGDKNSLSFILDLYAGKVNEYYCLINCINKFSFDIIIFNKEYKSIIKSIKIKADKLYTLDKCNNFGLKRVEKFGIINCDKSSLSEFNFEIPSHCSHGSYYLNIFYSSDKKEPKFSLQKIKQKTFKNIEFNSLSDYQKNYLLNLRKYITDLYHENICKKESIIIKKNNFQFQLNKKHNEVNEFPSLKNLEYLLARNIKLSLTDIEFEICLGYAIHYLVHKFSYHCNAILFVGLILNLLQQLEENLEKHNLNILRILFWYGKYYISTDEFKEKLAKYDKLEVPKPEFDFKLCFPKKCPKNTPYYNAYVFMKDFVDKLTEDSYILEILYLIDSESSSNRIYKSCRLFKFSLLSLEQIKSHLYALIPEVLVRNTICTNKYSNGSYIWISGVTRVYEKEIFKNIEDLDRILVIEEDTNYRYSIPLIMLLMHECFGHAKIRLRAEGSETSNYFYDPHNDYELSYHDENGESGRLIEYYICPSEDAIRFLKYSLIPLNELMNVNLWVGENMKTLNNIIFEKMKDFDFDEIKNQTISYFPKGGKRDNIEFANNDKDYDSEIYQDLYEDDKKAKLIKRKKVKRTEIFCE